MQFGIYTDESYGPCDVFMSDDPNFISADPVELKCSEEEFAALIEELHKAQEAVDDVWRRIHTVCKYKTETDNTWDKL